MADVLKVLGQINPSATTYTTLYTVPGSTQTTTSSLIACNTSGVSRTIRISVHVAGADAGAPTTKQFIYYDTVIGADATMTAVLGLTLDETDLIQAYASGTGMSFSLFGVETS